MTQVFLAEIYQEAQIRTFDINNYYMSDQFEVLKRENVSAKSQQVLDQIKSLQGVVPNLYSTLAFSENALEAYFRLETSQNSLSAREVAAVNLVVSEINNCLYSLSAHTIIAKQSGFTEDQTIEIRSGSASFDTQLDALIKLTKEIASKKNVETQQLLAAFYKAGYTNENLMDIIILIGDRTISNLLHTVIKNMYTQ